MSKKIIQFFKTSDSDKDDFLIITTADEELNLKNRKCLKKSELSIKDEKVNHLKESKNGLSKNKLATNQSSNILQQQPSLDDKVDKKENNLKLIIDKKDENVKENAEKLNIDSCLYQNDNIEHLYQSADDLRQHHHLYQNEIQSPIQNVIQNENLFLQTSEHIYQYIDDPLSDDDDRTAKQQNEIKHNKKQHKNFSFSPKSIKSKTIFSLTKAEETKLKKKQKDQQTKLNKNNTNHKEQQKVQPTLLKVNNNDDLSPNDDTAKKNRRRRRQNQSFENIDDRLQFAIRGSASNASSIANNKAHKNEDNEKSLKSNYKSEENLLSYVPPVPRSMANLNLNDKKILKELEERATVKLSDSLHKDSRLFAENPVYRPYNESLEEFKRLRDGLLKKTKPNEPHYMNNKEEHHYANNVDLERIYANTRQLELVELRKLKPKKYLLPDIRLTAEYETDILVYVNLKFDSETDSLDGYKNELNNNSSRNSDRNLSPTKLTYQERKRMLNTGLKGATQILNSQHKQNYLMKADLSKSTTDLGLLRCAKPGHVKSKSTDESDSSKIQYCRVDFAATESLTKLIETRKNHHS